MINLELQQTLNKLSSLHNKILMTTLSILILIMLIKAPSKFDDFSRIYLLVLWIIFVLISTMFTANGLLMYKFISDITEMQNSGHPIRGYSRIR